MSDSSKLIKRSANLEPAKRTKLSRKERAKLCFVPTCSNQFEFKCRFKVMTFDLGCQRQFCAEHETQIEELKKKNYPNRVCFICEDKPQRQSTKKFFRIAWCTFFMIAVPFIIIPFILCMVGFSYAVFFQ